VEWITLTLSLQGKQQNTKGNYMKKKIKEFNFKDSKLVGDKFKYAETKVIVTTRLDPPVLSWLKEESSRLGLGYQTLMNVILNQSMNNATHIALKKKGA
jgi:predicted DNA binding CopG/RHH family protein